MRKFQFGFFLGAGIFLAWVLLLSVVTFAGDEDNRSVFLPIIEKPLPTPTATPTPTLSPTPTPSPSPTPPPLPSGVEARALWVTRFDWTNGHSPAQPSKVDEIVNNAALAGFNMIFFQVRGAADAYYAPGLEPWAQRVSGAALGQPPNPYWDPLEYFINAAHARGIQVHAYINVYPVWDKCDSPPPFGTVPTHFYYLLRAAHGITDDKPNGLQWSNNGEIHCSIYQRSTPASVYADNHYLAVSNDLISRYAIDGIHLDNIRYGGSSTSCDPVSKAESGVDCFTAPPNGYQSYGDWQRAQVNGTVYKFYQQTANAQRDLWLTAAVWPVYSTGYNTYFQDSKAWLQGGYADSILPMIYTGSQSYWYDQVADYQSASNGRFVIPAISGTYGSFSEIEARIAMARALGTAGQAIFSYSSLASNGYFDDLGAGPYAIPAAVPEITWHD